MDALFTGQRYCSEIVWRRSSAHSDTKQGMRRCGKIHDVIFFYSKTDRFTWNPQFTPYTTGYLESEYRHVAPDGRRYKETDLTAAKPGGDVEYEWRVKRQLVKGVRSVADLDGEHRIRRQITSTRVSGPMTGASGRIHAPTSRSFHLGAI